jgi:hypothetical protein
LLTTELIRGARASKVEEDANCHTAEMGGRFLYVQLSESPELTITDSKDYTTNAKSLNKCRGNLLSTCHVRVGTVIAPEIEHKIDARD